MADWHYRSALVTGASSGLGREFALQLAARGCDLVLVARRLDKLREVAAEVKRAGRAAHVIAADLEQAEGRARLEDAFAKYGIDLLVNNAGYGRVGHFEEISRADAGGQVELNCRALVELTHLAVEHYRASGTHGGILNVASTASFMPVPYFAVYAATKAFVRSFSEGLSYELAPKGITVAAVCPGAAETEFFVRAGEEAAKLQKLMSARDCVQIALRKFGEGRRVIVTGGQNEFLATISRILPREWLASGAGKIFSKALKTPR